MPTPGQELAALDFESLIGGPLVAVVNAQGQAALATVNFVKQVGFKNPGGAPEAQTTDEPATVTFKYKKMVPQPDGTEQEKNAELTVPFLAMLPVPYLRVAETNVEFLAKIHATQYRRTDSSLNINAQHEAKAGFLFGSAKFKVSTTFQRNTQQGASVTRDYSMKVQVKAVQEEMPGGLGKLLSILEGAIQEKTA